MCTRMIRLVGLSTNVLLCLTCVSGWAQAAEKIAYGKLTAWQTAETADEKAYVRETYTLFRFMEPKYAKDELRKSADYKAFRRLVENEWKPAHPDRWNEIVEILEYCRQERFGTAMDDVEPDSRWELFLRYGKPRFNTPFTIFCGGGDDECTSWNFTFEPRRPGESPPTASCLIKPGMSYPTEILETQEQTLPDALPIYPEVTYSRFYGESTSEKVELWFSIWYSGDQFTRSTVDVAELTTTVELWDNSRTTLLDQHTSTYGLDALRGPLKALSIDERAKIRVMRYVRFGVRPGTYKARVYVKGADHYNEGSIWYDDPIVVPELSDMSDLLVLAQNRVQGAAVAECIQRGGEVYLCNRPQVKVSNAGWLDLYTEFRLPERSQNVEEVTATVTIRRLKEIQERDSKQSRAQIGQRYVEHFDGQPFLAGQSREDWEETVQDFFGGVDDRETMLLEQTIRINDPGAVQRLSMSAELRELSTGKEIPSGKYLLTVRIEDCGLGCVPAVSRTIYVISP
jgi:hypothetical protein